MMKKYHSAWYITSASALPNSIESRGFRNAKESKEITATIKTDKTTVGEALEELGLIAGHDTEYGLYIDTVNGTTLSWDTDKMYWSFYIDGEYAMTGVDATEIVAGSTYTIQAEKGE